MIEHWVHLRCAGIRLDNIPIPGPAINTENPGSHTYITPPYHPRHWTKPPTHSPPTPSIIPQPKNRHISYFLFVPPELVKPKPNPVTRSPPSHPTPPRAKHMHMSHIPHTPLTTLISESTFNKAKMQTSLQLHM